MKNNPYIEPVFSKSALIIIDMQNDFSLPGAVSEIIGTYEVIPKIKRILTLFRSLKRPIIHVIRLYKPDGSNVDMCRKKLIEEGKKVVVPHSLGSQIVKALLPNPLIRLDTKNLLKGNLQEIGDNEWVIYKSRWGAFYQTKIENTLKELGINTLVFCGCNFPNCPRTSIYEASERDFRIVFVKDATSKVYNKGIEELQNIGVITENTSDVIEHFQKLENI